MLIFIKNYFIQLHIYIMIDKNIYKKFPILTKKDIITRAKEANRDIEKGNVHDIESIEKEIW